MARSNEEMPSEIQTSLQKHFLGQYFLDNNAQGLRDFFDFQPSDATLGQLESPIESNKSLTFIEVAIKYNRPEILKLILEWGIGPYKILPSGEVEILGLNIKDLMEGKELKESTEIQKIVLDEVKPFIALLKGDIESFHRTLLDNLNQANALLEKQKLSADFIRYPETGAGMIARSVSNMPWMTHYLSHVSKTKDYAKLETLIQAGLPLNQPDASGKTIWDVALELKDKDLLKFLIQKTRPLLTVVASSKNNYPPLEKWIRANNQKNNDNIKLLLDCGLSPNYNPEDPKSSLSELLKWRTWSGNGENSELTKIILSHPNFDKDFVEKQNRARRVGHVLGLKDPYLLSFNNDILAINPQGSDTTLTSQWLRESLKAYIDQLDSEKEKDEELNIFFRNILESFQEESPHAKKVRYGNHQPVSTPMGWFGASQHYINVFYYDDLLAVTNRGNGRDPKYGTVIYLVDPNVIKESNVFDEAAGCLVKQLFGSAPLRSKEDFDRFLKEQVFLGPIPPSIGGTEQGTQKYGNCAFANLKSAIQTMLQCYFAKKMVSATVSFQEALNHPLVLARAKTEYKKYTQFLRDFEVKLLVSMINNTNLSPNERAFYFDNLKQVLLKHHKLEKHEGAELARTHYALTHLNPPYQESMQKALSEISDKITLFLSQHAKRESDKRDKDKEFNIGGDKPIPENSAGFKPRHSPRGNESGGV